LPDVPSVLNPFRDTALLYRDKWFKGVLILPYKMKESPPLDFTGRSAPYPTLEQIQTWCEDGKKHNICIRLAGVSDTHEIIGIDVDDYMKGDKKKHGGDQLTALEQRLGVLPWTWISTARLDGISGIRFFRVPRGLVFRGKADKDIEIIQKRHRYTLVWPSLHPEGGTYWWFPPGVKPDKQGKLAWGEQFNGELPDARNFPELPDKWVEYLSSNRIEMPEDGLIDVDSSVDEIYAWATDTFYGDGSDDCGPLCSGMRKKLDRHLEKISTSSTFHDLLTNAHWNLLNYAAEGHWGWNRAINELESVWADNVAKRGGSTVRDLGTLKGEIFRSRVQALRQIKAKIDEKKKIGAVGVLASCQKTGECGIQGNVIDIGLGTAGINDATVTTDGEDTGTAGSGDGNDPLSDIPQGALKAVPEYETNDDGNAEHFLDMFSTIDSGRSVRWANGYGWIIWHKGNADKQPHWQRDENADQEIRRMWQKVKDRQNIYAEACLADWQTKVEDFAKGQNGITEVDVKIAKAIYDKWNKWAEKSGNNRQAENAIQAARSFPGVAIDVNDLDQNPLLLGVANGVIELTDQVRLRRAVPEDYLTMNTNVAWEEPSTHAKNLWNDYLETFLPDPETRKATQVALGYCLTGGNAEKVLIVLKGDPNTGKSTMLNAIEAAMGDYAITVDQSLMKNQQFNTTMVQAMDKRVAICSEFDESDQLSASQVKRLTGDSDKISTQIKFSNAIKTGHMQCTMLLATNEVPGIRGADKALENRLHVIPFTMTPSRLQKGMSMVLLATCKTAILHWLVEGYNEYRRLGNLPATAEMKDAKKEFISELDEVATFVSENLAFQTAPEGYISRKAMYEKFNMWWIENNEQHSKIPSMPKFTRRLKALGYKTRNTRFRVNGEMSHWWTGVRFEKIRSNVISMPTFVSEEVRQESKTETPQNTL
jgi:P4 family phage/plasmid primase-like protien